MTGFIKVDGCIITGSGREAPYEFHHGQTHYIRASEIKELCEVVGNKRLRKEIPAQEYTSIAPDDRFVDRSANPDRYYKYVPTTEIAVAFVGGGTDRSVYDFHVGFLAAEPVAALKARIDAIEFPPAPAPEGPQIRDRGPWQPGESYDTFDMVANPDDVSKKLLALKPSRSTSKLVLSNKIFWGAVSVSD